jgi:hypothetical protein
LATLASTVKVLLLGPTSLKLLVSSFFSPPEYNVDRGRKQPSEEEEEEGNKEV